jgi:hypothetical protein
MIKSISHGGMIRRDGASVPAPAAWKNKVIDFGRRPVTAVLVPYADLSLSTAYFTTNLPNIEVYLTLPASERRTIVLRHYFG